MRIGRIALALCVGPLALVSNAPAHSEAWPQKPVTVIVPFGGLSAAHYLAVAIRDAVEWARKALQLRPGILGAHRCLCASLAQAVQIDEAKAEMGRLRQLQPDLSIAWIERSVPYTEAPMKLFLQGMRKAGLTG